MSTRIAQDPRTRTRTRAVAAALLLALISWPTHSSGQCLIRHEGRIIYENGASAAGITVTAGHPSGLYFAITNQYGEYEICIPQFGGPTGLAPAAPAGSHSVPPSRTCGYNGSCSGMDFTLFRHRVQGTVVMAVYDVSGIEITVEGQVAAVTDENGDFSFQPAGLDLPASGEVAARKSFYAFSPASLEYDVTSGDQVLSDISASADLDPTRALVSWEENSGTGWTRFTRSPGNVNLCFPNEPCVYARLDLDDEYFSTDIPAHRLRLVSDSAGILPAPVSASTAATAANGYVTTFCHVMSGCGRGNIDLQVGLPTSYALIDWVTLETLSGTGTSQLDLTGDHVVDLSDVGWLGQLIGISEGEPGFEPCADYIPDGVINLADVAIFAAGYDCVSGAEQQIADLGISEDRPAPRPSAGLQVSPNPSSSSVDLVVQLDRPASVSIDVLDVTGRLVRRLPGAQAEAVRHTLTWDGRDASGSRVSAGIYFARVTGGSAAVMRKIVRLD